MGWIIFFITTIILTVVTTPIRKWKIYWPIGLISMIVVLIVDSTFISLRAFSFYNPNPLLYGLPTFYLLSYFFSSLIYANHYPTRKGFQVPYILLGAFALLILEFFMVWTGYFYYIHWNPIRSLILNIFGFTFVSYLIQYFGLKREVY